MKFWPSTNGKAVHSYLVLSGLQENDELNKVVAARQKEMEKAERWRLPMLQTAGYSLLFAVMWTVFSPLNGLAGRADFWMISAALYVTATAVLLVECQGWARAMKIRRDLVSYRETGQLHPREYRARDGTITAVVLALLLLAVLAFILFLTGKRPWRLSIILMVLLLASDRLNFSLRKRYDSGNSALRDELSKR